MLAGTAQAKKIRSRTKICTATPIPLPTGTPKRESAATVAGPNPVFCGASAATNMAARCTRTAER
jgi:hypothetical protein